MTANRHESCSASGRGRMVTGNSVVGSFMRHHETFLKGSGIACAAAHPAALGVIKQGGSHFCMTPSDCIVLFVDDDPSHLKLYSWILHRGGFKPVTALVGSTSVNFPTVGHVDIVVMDYRLSSTIQAPALARMLRAQYPKAPIVLVSDVSWMPESMEGLVDDFIPKGEPEELLQKLTELATSPVHCKEIRDRRSLPE